MGNKRIAKKTLTESLINQKGRGGKTNHKLLTNKLKYFFEKRRIFEINVVVVYRKETEENRFNLLLGNCHGRITYKELIN